MSLLLVQVNYYRPSVGDGYYLRIRIMQPAQTMQRENVDADGRDERRNERNGHAHRTDFFVKKSKIHRICATQSVNKRYATDQC